MSSKTISVLNGDGSTRTITIPDRSRFAGVRNISRAVNALPLTDSTTSIQVTVAGHADISGIYTGTTVAGATWNQQGGNGTITASSFNETDGYEYLLEDGSDSDPQYLLNNNAGFTDRPWKANLANAVTITGIAGTETLTVNRTAPVITSDRKGESRPLLSKLVGGAAAAYSLRDLNDRNGNNKVVEVRRSSGGSKKFLAKEVSNGTLEGWVTAPQTGWNTQATFNDTPDGTANITSASSTATTSTVSFTGSGTIRVLPKSNYVTAEAGDQVVFNMSVSGLDSAMTFRIRKASSNTTVGTASVNNGDNQDVTLNLTASGGYTGGYPHFTADAGSGEATVTINSVTVTGKTGFVETWYDQSGNGNDATQLTSGSQPKIVNAGSLVTGGIDFLDGTDTFLETTNSDICNVAQLSAFTVLTPHLASSQTAAFSSGATVAGSTGYGGWEMNLNGYGDLASFQTQTKGDNTSGINGIHFLQTGVTSSEALISFVSTFPNASISKDGGTAVTTSSMNAPSQPVIYTRRFRIGCKYTFRPASFYTQPINEIILYTSDQSANRPAIEANIKNQYEIS